MSKGILTLEQINLAAKYFAASNTGLLGIGFKQPKTKEEILNVFHSIDNEYLYNMGEGLDEELEMWLNDMKNLQEGDCCYNDLKKEVPFIFE